MAVTGIFAPVRRVEPEVSNRLIRRFCQLIVTYLTTGTAESPLGIPFAQLRRILTLLCHDAFTGEDGAWDDIGPATKRAFALVYGNEDRENAITAALRDSWSLEEGALPEDRKSKLVKFLQELSQGIPVSNQ